MALKNITSKSYYSLHLKPGLLHSAWQPISVGVNTFIAIRCWQRVIAWSMYETKSSDVHLILPSLLTYYAHFSRSTFCITWYTFNTYLNSFQCVYSDEKSVLLVVIRFSLWFSCCHLIVLLILSLWIGVLSAVLSTVRDSLQSWLVHCESFQYILGILLYHLWPTHAK